MQRFSELRVWQRSHILTKAIYELTSTFPADERFGLTQQLRRAASSVPCNIAEGAKKAQRRDFARFLNIAEGSMAEAEYLLLLASELGYASTANEQREAEEISRMLCAFREQVLARDREERRRSKSK